MQDYQNIAVPVEVHAQVKRVAEANQRTLIGQVRYWLAQSCQHPVKARQSLDFQISYPGQTDIIPARGFKCNACGRLVVLDGREEAEE